MGEGEVFCHWYSWDELTYDADMQLIPFQTSRRLLIGGTVEFKVNEHCRGNGEYSNRLARFQLRTKKREWKNEARGWSGTFSKIVGIGLTLSQKLHPAFALYVIIEEWVTELGRNPLHQPEPAYLDQVLGLEINSCTGNARRVRLWELLRGSDVVMYVKKRSTEKQGAKYAKICSNDNSFSSLWRESTKTQNFLKKVISNLIWRLGGTGCEDDGKVKAWDISTSTTGVEIQVAWASLLKDCASCATFAMLTNRCLEYKGYKCRSKNRERGQGAALLTRIIISHQSSDLATGEDPTFTARECTLSEEQIYYDRHPVEDRNKRTSEFAERLRLLRGGRKQQGGGPRSPPHRALYPDPDAQTAQSSDGSWQLLSSQQPSVPLQPEIRVKGFLPVEIFPLQDGRGRLRVTTEWSNHQIEVGNTYEHTPISVTWEPSGTLQEMGKLAAKGLGFWGPNKAAQLRVATLDTCMCGGQSARFGLAGSSTRGWSCDHPKLWTP